MTEVLRITDETLAKLVGLARGPCAIGLLVTHKDPAKVYEWSLDAGVEMFDRRGRTTRCRLWLHDALPGADDPVARVRQAMEGAEKLDVTLQLLCTEGVDESTRRQYDLGFMGASVDAAEFYESYPVLVLNSEGLKWAKTCPK